MIEHFSPQRLTSPTGTPQTALPFYRKLIRMPWLFLLTLCIIAALGIATLHSIQHNQQSLLADQQLIRFLLALMVLLVTALIPTGFWMRASYPLYGAALLLVLLVPFIGIAPAGAGARRWLLVGGMSLQPSEFLKITLILALARTYQLMPANKISNPLYLLAPMLIILLPLGPIFMQPDLGTALLIAMIGISMLFLAGINSLYFIGSAMIAVISLPFLWQNLLPYQRERVFTFLEPERDPLGSGYHLLQSKIALGSAGLWGKGAMQGTQSQLNFLPEKHTDFIFAMFTEERGFVGAAILMGLYILAIALLWMMALRTKELYGRFVLSGIAVTLFLYVFINMGMVMGMLPVVGVPLPLMSYGGTSTLSIMFGIGVGVSAYIHRQKMPRR